MPTARINKSNVDAVVPASKDLFLWDDKISGFGLKVTPAGSRVYLYQYRLEGGRAAKIRRYTIGKHGALTPDQARGEANRLSMLVAHGVDPQSERVERKRQSIDLAFPAYLDAFGKTCLAERWRGSAPEVEAMLRTHALPSLRSKALPEIGRADVTEIMRPLKDRPALSSKLFAVLRYLFRHAVSEGDLLRSPMEGMKPPPLPASRERVLDDCELAAVWKASRELGYPFGPFTRLLIVTGARREEIAGLAWSEVDRDHAMWTLPAERSKNSLGARMPLSPLAIAELDNLASRTTKVGKWPKTGLVLSTTGKTSISGYSRAKSRLDSLIRQIGTEDANPTVGQPWRFHDLRRTMATGLQRLGVRFEVTEAILNHVSGSRSGVAGIYQRHEWADEKRAALNAWSDYIQAHIAGKTDNLEPL